MGDLSFFPTAAQITNPRVASLTPAPVTQLRRPRLKLRVEFGAIWWDVGTGRPLRFDADSATVLRDVFLTAGEMDAHFDVEDALLALSQPDGAA